MKETLRTILGGIVGIAALGIIFVAGYNIDKPQPVVINNGSIDNGGQVGAAAKVIVGAQTVWNSDFAPISSVSLGNPSAHIENYFGTKASLSSDFEVGGYASASAFKGSAFTGVGTCTGTSFLHWADGAFTCGTPSGGGTPGGSNHTVQYNNNNTFGGFGSYSSASDELTLTGDLFGTNLTLNSTGNNTLTMKSTSATSNDSQFALLAVPTTDQFQIRGGGLTSDEAIFTLASPSGGGRAFDISHQYPGINAANIIAAYTTYGDFARFVIQSAFGTRAAPTKSLADLPLGNIQFRGFDGTNFAAAARVGITGFAEEDYTSTAQGSYMTFATTPTGSVTSAERLRVTGAGLVGINVTNPGVQLDVKSATSNTVFRVADDSGTCNAQPTTTGLTWGCSSDKKLKKDIGDASPKLPYLLDMPLFDYTVIKTGERAMGPIAQEMQKVHPELVASSSEGLSVSTPTTWDLVKAIQELDAQNKALEARVSDLESRIAKLDGKTPPIVGSIGNSLSWYQSLWDWIKSIL